MKCKCGNEVRKVPDKTQESVRHEFIVVRGEKGFNWSYPSVYAEDGLCDTCSRLKNTETKKKERHRCCFCGFEWLSRGGGKFESQILNCKACGRTNCTNEYLFKY